MEEQKQGGIVPINLMDAIVSLDVETGGLVPGRHALLQVALVGSRGRELTVDVWDGREVTAKALEVNGINLDEHKKTALPPPMAWVKIREFLDGLAATAPGGKLWTVGQHVAFDLNFLEVLFQDVSEPSPLGTYRSVDTKTLLFARYMRSEIPEQALSLGPACAHFGVKHEGQHTALGDARATRELLVRLVHPGCYEKNGLICANVQRLQAGSWQWCEFDELRVGDIFRKFRDGAWEHPCVVNTDPVPEGALGNSGLQATCLTAEQIMERNIPA